MDYLNYIQDINYMRGYDYYVEREMNSQLPWVLNFQDKSFQYNLNIAIQKIKQSVQDERDDETFYDALIKLVPNEESKRIIESIRDDERIHNRLLRKMFTDLTGVVLPTANIEPSKENTNLTYIKGLEQALFGELKAVEKYREIMTYMPNMDLHNMAFYILTDEMKHANKYNFLITNYLVKNA